MSYGSIQVKSHETTGSVTYYCLYLNDKLLSRQRFSAFELLGKDLEKLGVQIPWKDFPHKLDWFATKNEQFYNARRAKLETFLQEIIKLVLVTDNAQGQNLIKTFLGIEPNVRLPDVLLNASAINTSAMGNINKQVNENEKVPMPTGHDSGHGHKASRKRLVNDFSKDAVSERFQIERVWLDDPKNYGYIDDEDHKRDLKFAASDLRTQIEAIRFRKGWPIKIPEREPFIPPVIR